MIFYRTHTGRRNSENENIENEIEQNEKKNKKKRKKRKEEKKQRQRPRNLVSRFKKFSSTRQEFDFPDASRSTKHGIHSILSITK